MMHVYASYLQDKLCHHDCKLIMSTQLENQPTCNLSM